MLPSINSLPDPECLSRFSEFSPLSGVSGDIAAAVGFTSIFVSRKL